jgi:hypothetical protein
MYRFDIGPLRVRDPNPRRSGSVFLVTTTQARKGTEMKSFQITFVRPTDGHRVRSIIKAPTAYEAVERLVRKYNGLAIEVVSHQEV